ncbi:TetR/AcrR family transcriptional regulator [Butyrivibrio sp. M55]|jgi:AcrR family transcriptional regulator|uniref:TetR/AcrR family transcriptional regulator n=1 Tax=Butyrivibrio sp. M55 TaxID=1855323 RepID=UPI0008E7037E|nr:TetR/AcrR family transcriptional regulator [Butyrivibrio sp. M55]SFU68892.1 transcriptional regulator, TetR family [Butyrivibrio sp. M55]
MDDLKERIIDETIMRFNKVGLKFTLDELVDGMHISKKTVYKQFGNKADLLKAVIDYVFEGIREKEIEIIDDDSIDLVQKIRLSIVCLPDKYKDIDFRKVYQLKTKYPDVYEYLIYRIENSWDNVDRLLIKAMEKKLIKDMPLTFVRLIFIGSIKQLIASREMLKVGLSFSEIMETSIDVIMAGILI